MTPTEAAIGRMKEALAVAEQAAREEAALVADLRAREAELVAALELALDAGDDVWSQAPEWYRQKDAWCGEQLDAARAALPPTPEKKP